MTPKKHLLNVSHSWVGMGIIIIIIIFPPSIPRSCTRTKIKHTYLDELNQMMMWWDTDETMLWPYVVMMMSEYPSDQQLMELLVKAGGGGVGVLSLCNTFDNMGWCSIGWTISSIHSIPFGKHNQEPNHGKSRCTNWTESNTMVHEYVTTSYLGNHLSL